MQKRTTGTRALAPRISEDSAQWYSRNFPSLNAGVTWTLEEFPRLYEITISEMRGTLTQGELMMVLDVLNGHGTLLSYGGSGLAGQSIRLSISDSFSLYPNAYEEKWGVESFALNSKLAYLSRWQLVCLEIWAAGYWEYAHTSVSAEEYCKSLI